jgi:hypothetical protein
LENLEKSKIEAELKAKQEAEEAERIEKEEREAKQKTANVKARFQQGFCCYCYCL